MPIPPDAPLAALPTDPLGRRVIENALFAWLVAGTGLVAERVWWSSGEAVETTYPFATLSWLSTTPLGPDGVSFQNLTDDLEDDVEDVRLWVGTLRAGVVSVQVHTSVDEQPEAGAFLRLEAAIAKLWLPSRRDLLFAAGVGIVGAVNVRQIRPGVAAADINVTIASNISEDVFSIQQVHFYPDPDDHLLGDDFIAPEPPDEEVPVDPE